MRTDRFGWMPLIVIALLISFASLAQNNALFDQGKQQYKAEKFDEAIQIIESGLALNGNNSELNYRAGAYLYLTNDKISAFNRWNNAFMESPLKLNQIFDFCNKLKDDTEVVEFFEQF